jgi:hypothetical protein
MYIWYIYISICLVGVIMCYSYPSEKTWSESQLGYVGMMIPNMMGKIIKCSKPPIRFDCNCKTLGLQGPGLHWTRLLKDPLEIQWIRRSRIQRPLQHPAPKHLLRSELRSVNRDVTWFMMSHIGNIMNHISNIKMISKEIS